MGALILGTIKLQKCDEIAEIARLNDVLTPRIAVAEMQPKFDVGRHMVRGNGNQLREPLHGKRFDQARSVALDRRNDFDCDIPLKRKIFMGYTTE